MKKLVLMCVLTMGLMATSAQAAVFTFEGLAPGLAMEQYEITTVDADTGLDVTATFDHFNVVSNNELHDYLSPWDKEVASISFTTGPVFLNGITGWATPMPEQPIATAFLDDVKVADIFSFSEAVFGAVDHLEFSAYITGISSVDVSPTPLPGAVFLLGSGLLGLVGLRRRFQQ